MKKAPNSARAFDGSRFVKQRSLCFICCPCFIGCVACALPEAAAYSDTTAMRASASPVVPGEARAPGATTKSLALLTMTESSLANALVCAGRTPPTWRPSGAHATPCHGDGRVS
jgi:hypothetical protein